MKPAPFYSKAVKTLTPNVYENPAHFLGGRKGPVQRLFETLSNFMVFYTKNGPNFGDLYWIKIEAQPRDMKMGKKYASSISDFLEKKGLFMLHDTNGKSY